MAIGIALGVSAATKVIGGIRNKRSADKAAREQESITQANAARERAETAEALRRTGQTFGRLESTSRAASAASGLGGRSRELYQQSLERSHQEELDWMRESGASRTAIMEREGQAQADITRRRGKSALISGIGDAFMTGAGIWR